jgi:hypothetical protein
MDLGWTAVIQSILIAASTVTVRVLAKSDKREVINKTASPDDVKIVRLELEELRAEFNVLKDAYFKQNPVQVDHRGPSKG